MLSFQSPLMCPSLKIIKGLGQYPGMVKGELRRGTTPTFVPREEITIKILQNGYLSVSEKNRSHTIRMNEKEEYK